MTWKNSLVQILRYDIIFLKDIKYPGIAKDILLDKMRRYKVGDGARETTLGTTLKKLGQPVDVTIEIIETAR